MKKNLVLFALSLFPIVGLHAATIVPDFDVSYAVSNLQASASIGSLTNRASGVWLGNLRGGDTWRDLVVANDADNTVSVRLSNDNGTFNTLTNYAVGLNP